MTTDEETICHHTNTLLSRKREREEKESSTQDDIISNTSSIQIQNLRQSYDNVFAINWKDKIIRDKQQILDYLKPNSLWFIYSNFYFNSQKLKSVSELDSYQLINHIVDNMSFIKKGTETQKELSKIEEYFERQKREIDRYFGNLKFYDYIDDKYSRCRMDISVTSQLSNKKKDYLNELYRYFENKKSEKKNLGKSNIKSKVEGSMPM